MSKCLWTLSGPSAGRKECVTYPPDPHECGKKSGPHGGMTNQHQTTRVSAELGFSPASNSAVVMKAKDRISQ